MNSLVVLRCAFVEVVYKMAGLGLKINIKKFAKHYQLK